MNRDFLDILSALSAERAEYLLVGAPLLDLTREELISPETVFQIGVAPQRIDILASIDGLTFDEAWGDHMVREIGGVQVPVIGRDALIRNKRASGRV